MAVTTERAAGEAIRPFTYKATDAELEDLRTRIAPSVTAIEPAATNAG